MEKIRRKDFIQEQLETPQRESSFGYHFIMEFVENPYHFYLRYVLGIQPEKKGKALLFGGSIHTAIESFYRCEDPDPIEVFLAIHKFKEQQYFDPKDYAEDAMKGQRMLNAWMSKIPMEEAERGRKVVEAEVQHDIVLANGFPMTIRIDRVMEERGVHYLKEVKTTGYSISVMFDSVKRSDQVTTYLMGYLKATGKKASQVYIEPEILYARGAKAEVACPAYIMRSAYELQRNEMSLISWYARLYNALKLLEKGYPAPMAFPRNSTTNRQFPQSLEGLMEIPHTLLEGMAKENQLPPGYILDERVTGGLLNEFKRLWESTEGYSNMEVHYALG